MIALFKSRKSAMVLIGLAILTALSIVNDYDVTKEIVAFIYHRKCCTEGNKERG